MPHTLWRTLFVLFCLAPAVSNAQESPRLDIGLNGEWKFVRQDVAGTAAVDFDDSAWQQVNLPHTWNNMDAQDGGNDYYRGVGWYRRHLVVDVQHVDKSLFLKFNGAASVAEVFVNGKHVGSHKGNFAAFCFDVTPVLKVGRDNLIAVKVNNAMNDDLVPLGGDFPIFGGLYRDVHLLVLNRLSVTPLDYASAGVYIKQVHATPDAAELEITTKLRNANNAAKTATVRCTISDAKGNKVRESSSSSEMGTNSATDVVQRVTIARPHLWNGRIDPHLYSLTVNVSDGDKITDTVTQPVGVRYFRVDPNEGFFLNGKRYELRGVGRHQDRLDKS
jgi:beta-galactosidase